ncbi:hypothetical protein FACS189460_0860 [Deltaproteobacteria bacterium]|nr:hypothetical protein FACS189460_0860 [Deltaproteobacteria bacterium]
MFRQSMSKLLLDGLSLGFPLLPVPGDVVFPHQVVTLAVTDKKSIQAMEYARSRDEIIFLSATKLTLTQAGADLFFLLINPPWATDLESDEGKPDYSIFDAGTIGTILELKTFDGQAQVKVQGQSRGHVHYFDYDPDEWDKTFYSVYVETLTEPNEWPQELEALAHSLNSAFAGYAQRNPKITPEMVAQVTAIQNPSRRCDSMAQYLPRWPPPGETGTEEDYFEGLAKEKQNLLELLDPLERMAALEKILLST